MNCKTASALTIILSTSTALAQEYRYAIFEVPWFPNEDYSTAKAIAEDGVAAVGSVDQTQRSLVLLWTNDKLSEDQGYGGNVAINANHDMVGNRDRVATLWRNDGKIFNLGALGGEFSDAYGINDLGQITGAADLSETHPDGAHAFLWENGVMRDLGSPGRLSVANAINNASQIAGWFVPQDNNSTTPFFWENDRFTILPNLSASRPASAEDLNDDGVAVGWADVPIYGHAVKWINGEIFDINDGSAADESLAQCINNLGDICGFMYLRAEQRTVGFLIEAGTTRMLNLNQYLPPHRRFDITWVNGINDFGQIAGRDVPRDHGVILSPVTPTMQLNDPLPGTAGRNNRLTLTGATPGERIYFLYSTKGGGTVIPGCDLQTGAAAQIDDPIVIGAANADANGIATITKFVPPIARGHDILIQAVQKNGCKVSQLVVHQFD